MAKLGNKGGGRSTAKTPAQILGGLRGIVGYLFVLSGVVNILALTGAIYMLQIYDRALTSQSIPTLLALSLLAIGLYLFQGILDVIRSQILVRLGAKFDHKLSPLAHKVAIDMPRFGFSAQESLDRSRDVDTVRQFISSQGPVAFFDLPWMPVYVAFVYFLHPYLGLLTLAGAIVLTMLTVLTEILTQSKAAETHKSAVRRSVLADSNARNADILYAMGFAHHVAARYATASNDHLALQTRTNDITGTLSGLAKVMRMVLQSAVLGLGAYLTILGDLTAGAIIAASVAAARALAPVDLAIGQWKNFVAARRSYKRLGETLASLDDASVAVALPSPKESLNVEKITVAVPGSGTVVIADVGFELKAGKALGIIGPSGGGKTSLARAIVGVWPLVRGAILLDEAHIEQWSREELGKSIGYLPQDVSMLEGTIAENISRFDPQARSESILEAARAAGIHEMIVRLPDGYQTQLGPRAASLSAGQLQRVALARALYGNPFLVVLDEPNSNLDAEGDQALTESILAIRKRGGIAIIIAHRPSALVACDMVGVIQNGRLAAFGPKDEIIRDRTPAKQTNIEPAVAARRAL